MDADAVYQTRAIQEDQFLMISDTVIRMTDLIEQAHGKNSGIAKAAFLISRTLQVVQQIMAARTAAAGVRASGYMLMGDPATVESRAQMVLMTGYANAAITAGMAIGELAARADGGPVQRGRRYLVGERGPEILTMGNNSGTITPNHAIVGGEQKVTTNVVINNAPEGAQVSRSRTRVSDVEIVESIMIDFLKNPSSKPSMAMRGWSGISPRGR